MRIEKYPDIVLMGRELDRTKILLDRNFQVKKFFITHNQLWNSLLHSYGTTFSNPLEAAVRIVCTVTSTYCFRSRQTSHRSH